MIDKITGSILLDNQKVVLNSRLSPENFMNTSLYQGEIIDTKYLIKDTKDINGKRFLITLFFISERLKEVHLSEVMNGISCSNWTEDIESEKKKSHDKWLLKILGNGPYVYSWGTVESTFDKKGAVSSIILRYR
ncbi:hypothetical protein P6709_06835 [Jeotgalibacillus sp. ET6]|uniref:hypothetical protein n=1 Tax=Jeotgalibacillus sp. ET6 TaxID=3037260 RepID=UPI002418879C|nr:hypothetical protein [Jeotgalibacillus sp. ET6]MDG5471457.1 hypothetical protein [Jeotgalibacillus sp. ET6]